MTTREDRDNPTDRPAYIGTEWMRVATRYYDPERDEELTTTVAYAIADARNRSPGDETGPPLYDCLDVPALETVLFGDGDESHEPVGVVEFRYGENLVTVDSDGQVVVYEPTLSGPP